MSFAGRGRTRGAGADSERPLLSAAENGMG
jgi:hypothetical protein